MKRRIRLQSPSGICTLVIILSGTMPQAHAQQKELPEAAMLTAVPNFGFRSHLGG